MHQRPKLEAVDLAGSGLRLRCLGTFRLIHGFDRDLTPRGRKARALLAYLSLHDGPVPRDKLADLLWSTRGEEQAKSSLRQSLFEIRHIETAPLLWDRGRDEVGLVTGLIETDVTSVSLSDVTSATFQVRQETRLGSSPNTMRMRSK